MMKRFNLLLASVLILFGSCQQKVKDSVTTEQAEVSTGIVLPHLKTSTHEDDTLARVFRIALGDLMGNIYPYKGGLLKDSADCLYAGLDYYGPWSRDGGVNISNGFGLLAPTVAKHTLMSQLVRLPDGRLVFGGEYWDNVLQTEAHYKYYLQTGDTSLLHEAIVATLNTLKDRERDEFDLGTGLFRGAAGFNDGISAYPDLYARTGTYTPGGHWLSNIKKWPEVAENKPFRAHLGFGLPMMPLSTNCNYFMAYSLLPKMAKVIGYKLAENYVQKADTLKKDINEELWVDGASTYMFFKDPNGNSMHQEGEGLARAISLGIADSSKARRILLRTHQTKAGIPCLWPGYKRYDNALKGNTKHYPRHAQTVWSQVQSFWAHAAATMGDSFQLHREAGLMAKHAFRDGMFYELYHPDNELPYGGIQEDNNGKMVVWQSARRQSWAASGYLHLVMTDILGVQPTEAGIIMRPNLSRAYSNAILSNLRIRTGNYTLTYKGVGTAIKRILLDGSPVQPDQPIPYQSGKHKVEIEMVKQ